MTSVLVVAAIVGFGCAGLPSPTEDPPLRLTVLHTNDHHGHFWSRRDGSYGLAARKTLIDRVRAEVAAQGGEVLLLDAGDVNTGVPESDGQDAEPDFRGMSLLGYDAMAVGNHEFDKSPTVMERQRREWSRFPWLAANVYRRSERVFEPYRVFEKRGQRIAVLGLTTEDTAKMGLERRHPGVAVAPAAENAKDVVGRLRGIERADFVIALTHLGYYVDGQHGVSAPGDVELAHAVPGIDLIVGGHTHSIVCMEDGGPRMPLGDAVPASCTPDRQGNTWIVQAGDRGRFVGRADFELRRGAGPKLLSYALLPVNPPAWASGHPASPPLPQDAAAVALLEPYQNRGQTGGLEPVGRSTGRFDGNRATVRWRPAALGVLITQAMRAGTGADVALLSAGGIRGSLPEGLLRLRDVSEVLPFSNEVIVVTLGAEELRRYLGTARAMTPGSGAYPQCTGASFRDGELSVGGRPAEPDRRYRLALSRFVAQGGDGYPALIDHPGASPAGLTDAQLLRDLLASRNTLDPHDFEPAGAEVCSP